MFTICNIGYLLNICGTKYIPAKLTTTIHMVILYYYKPLQGRTQELEMSRFGVGYILKIILGNIFIKI